MTERERAFRILEQVERDEAYAAPLLQDSGREARDAAFIRTIVLGVLRWRNRLDAIIERLSKRSAGNIDRPALQILRMGIYQIALMDVPDYAAVGESVTLAHRFAARAAGFVNAVLRSAAREKGRLWEETGLSEHVRLGHPQWMLERWKGAYGPQRASRIAAADQELSYPDLLVNSRRTTMDGARAILESRGILFEPSPLVPGVLRLRGSTEELKEEIEGGLFHPMDEGSAAIGLIAARLADGGTLLDVAAAPGGKTMVAALSAAKVTANDLSVSRLRHLMEVTSRVLGAPVPSVVSDGAMLPMRGTFDAVLLDAPCSATGTIRKSPEVKWRLKMEMIEAAAALQQSLLISALQVTRRYCLYATCSLESEENEAVVRSALASRSGFERGDLTPMVPDGIRPWIQDGVLRLTPESGADGFTAHLLQRS